MIRHHFPLLVLILLLPARAATGEQTELFEDITSERIARIVQQIADSQIRFLADFGTGLSYRSRWLTHDQDETTAVIGSSEGLVGRLYTRRGKPLTSTESAKEYRRLVELQAPGKVHAANRGSARLQPYFLQMIRAMPQAMIYTPVAGQPQRERLGRLQLVLDYRPNPAFQPKSLAENTLRDLSGRIWIDARTHHLLRIEIHVDRDVNIAAGLLIKVYHDGTVEYEQGEIAPGRDAWSHIRLKLNVREFLLKTTALEAELTATDIRLLPAVPAGPDAIRALLAEDAQR